MRTAWAVAGAVVLLAVIGVVIATSSGRNATSATQEPSASTAPVERGKLAAMVTLDGILTYRDLSDGSPYPAINQAGGTYTELPNAGDDVDCGDVFYRVDDEPVLMLCGTVPAYRDLAVGLAGKDVRQLNRNLHELGYDADAGVGIGPRDNDFTWRTVRALEQLQDDTGFDVTGALDRDDAVVLPGSARISEVTGVLGGPARPGEQVARATSDTLEVRVDLDATQQNTVKQSDPARIILPGNTAVQGTVDRLGRVAEGAGTNDDSAAASIVAYIGLDQPQRARGLDRAPVQVEITTEGVRDALSVPVTALVGAAGGGYAVEVVRDGKPAELVAVELGLFDTAAGRVEVEGELDEEARVVVPAS